MTTGWRGRSGRCHCGSIVRRRSGTEPMPHQEWKASGGGGRVVRGEVEARPGQHLRHRGRGRLGHRLLARGRRRRGRGAAGQVREVELPLGRGRHLLLGGRRAPRRRNRPATVLQRGGLEDLRERGLGFASSSTGGSGGGSGSQLLADVELMLHCGRVRHVGGEEGGGVVVHLGEEHGCGRGGVEVRGRSGGRVDWRLLRRTRGLFLHQRRVQ